MEIESRFTSILRDLRTTLRILLLITAMAFGLPLLYFLSLGPVGWLVSHGVLPDEPLYAFYHPLMSTSFLGLDGLTDRYYNWWVPPKPFYCGGTGDFAVGTTETKEVSTGVATAAQTNAPARGTLVLGILKIEGSYARNTERPSRGVPDTVQFWIGPEQTWRIRTYAIDHDIHLHDLGKLEDQPAEFAREHIKKHYGDVLASFLVFESIDTSDTNAVQRLLAQHKLKGKLEVAAKQGFAFWNPDNGHYKTQTTPK